LRAGVAGPAEFCGLGIERLSFMVCGGSASPGGRPGYGTNVYNCLLNVDRCILPVKPAGIIGRNATMSRTKATEDATGGAAPAAGGRQRLMQAALRIGASRRSLQSLGLRELAREAGLNPNTFYRHFNSLEELSQAIIDELGRDLRTNLRGIRRTVRSPVDEATPRTVEYVFDFAARNPDAFIVAVRELHGAMPTVREALQRMIGDVAQEMVEDVQFLNIGPQLEEATLRDISHMVVTHVFHQTLDYIEFPTRRTQILRQTVRFIDMLFAGAALMQTLKADTMAQVLERAAGLMPRR